VKLKQVPVSESLTKLDFDCGYPDLNNYLRHYALKNDRLSIGKTFIALSDSEIAGYFTISTAQILANDLPEDIKKKLPRYPVPAFRIGKLAVKKEFQGLGVGKWLLTKALEKAVLISSEVAIYAVLVDAIDEKAKLFYLKYGFVPFQEFSLTLFLPIDTIKKARG